MGFFINSINQIGEYSNSSKKSKIPKNKFHFYEFSVYGKNPKTNHMKTVTVVARENTPDEEIATKSGLLEPITIEITERSLQPSEAQIRYARDLKIHIPNNCDSLDLHCLISRATGEYRGEFVSFGLAEYAATFNMRISSYDSQMSAIDQIMAAVIRAGNRECLTFWAYIYYCVMHNEEVGNLYNSLHKDIFYQFADKHLDNDILLETVKNLSLENYEYFFGHKNFDKRNTKNSHLFETTKAFMSPGESTVPMNANGRVATSVSVSHNLVTPEPINISHVEGNLKAIIISFLKSKNFKIYAAAAVFILLDCFFGWGGILNIFVGLAALISLLIYSITIIINAILKKTRPFLFINAILSLLLLFFAIGSLPPVNKGTPAAEGTISEGTSLEPKAEATTKAITKFSLTFQPKIDYKITDATISISADVDCPDGTILQVSMLDADLKDAHNEKLVVKDKKIACDFTLNDASTRELALMVMLQFNADSLTQPAETKAVFGEYGEKLEGDTAEEAKMSNGEYGKNASLTTTINYPSNEAVEAAIKEKYSKLSKDLVAAGNGFIIALDNPQGNVYNMRVSNSWYLSTEEEKQYFAEEALLTVESMHTTLYGEDLIVIFKIYDESENLVAESKLLGGMQVKK